MKSGKKLWLLFLTFFKIGAFTFGGGYAMIPLIQRETAEKYGWVSDDDILEIIAIAESTPGPIAINSATFIGYRVGGVLGSACATLGVVLPSFIIISLIALLLRDFQDLKPVKYAFYGIRAGVLALLLKALWTMFKKCPKKAVSYAIVACAFVLSAIVGLNVLIIIASGAVVGLTASLIAERRSGK
ncbi:MAG: chromate transporter [Clostridia bacterium]|nr:chromate transporter [Clostridia bacterium]